MTEAYPLHWPEGWPRSRVEQRKWSLPGGRQAGWSGVVDRLIGELRRLGARNIVVSTNQPLRRDGLPYAATRRIEDPGAAVYFALNDRPMAMAQDRYELLVDNIRSLALAIEGMRQMERHGGGHMMARAFTGFQALPAPGAGRHWAEVLDVGTGASRAEIEQAYRRRAFNLHPDRGGSTEAMAELNVAYNQACARR